MLAANPALRTPGRTHIWTNKDPIIVNSGFLLNKFHTSVTVRRIPHQEMSNLFGDTKEIITDIFGSSEMKGLKGFLNEFIESTSKVYRADSAGFFLTNYLLADQMIKQMYSNMNKSIVMLQKIGNVVYIQSVTIIEGVEIQEKESSVIYSREEVIMISTADDLYVISTQIPATEPARQHPHYAWVTDWLNEFKLVIR